MSRPTRLNQDIRAQELRVIDSDGKQLGVMSRLDALARAQDAGLDLVEISPDANPPVVKIIDWGKYQYQQTKKQKRNAKAGKSHDLKQMRFGLKISDHDLGVKLKKVNSFLDEGHTVKILIIYRGRELAHKELGYDLAEKVKDLLGENVKVEQEPQFAGRFLTFVVRKNHAKN